MSIETTQYGKKKRGRSAYRQKASKIARVADNIYTLKYSYSHYGAGGFLHPQVWDRTSIFYELHPGSILVNGATIDQINFLNNTPIRQADEATADTHKTRTTDIVNWTQFKLELDISYQYGMYNHIKRGSNGRQISTDLRIIILQIMDESNDKGANTFQVGDFYYSEFPWDMTTCADRLEMKTRESQGQALHGYKVILDELIPMHMDNEVGDHSLVPLAEHQTVTGTELPSGETTTFNGPIYSHQWGNHLQTYYKQGMSGKRIYREFKFKPGMEYMITNFNSEINREKGRIIWGVYANGHIDDGANGLTYHAANMPAINTCMTFKWKKAAA